MAGDSRSESGRSSGEGKAMAVWVLLARGAAVTTAAVLFGLFAAVVIGRWHYPTYVEWMTGSIMDHVARVRSGEPVFAPPSLGWIPFIYPPLYYQLSALASIGGSVGLGCRVVSLASTAVTATCVAWIARRLGATRYWMSIALGLFFAAYSFTGYWYDIERCDALFVALLSAGAATVLATDGLAGAALGGAIIGLAFFAKQPAIAFVVAGCLGLALERRGWRWAAFAGAGAAVIGAGVAALDARSAGWFSTYTLTIPSSHGIKLDLFSRFFVQDLCSAFLLTAATLAGFSHLVRLALRAGPGAPSLPSPGSCFGASLLAGAFVSSAGSRLHLGGWDNVLMFWTTPAVVAVAVVATRVEEFMTARGLGGAAALALSAASILQMGHWAHDPGDHTSSSRRAGEDAAFRARIDALEREGEVFVLSRSHDTRMVHFHVQALADLLRAGLPLPDDIARAFEARRFAALVVDEFQELTMDITLGHRGPFFHLLSANYFVAERLEPSMPPPTGWPATPSWVMRPRRRPLPDANDDALLARQRVEAAIAQMRADVRAAGGRTDDSSVEDVAERLMSAVPAEGKHLSP